MGCGGRIVRCGCQEESVLDGVGMGLPSLYQETVRKIRDGKFGNEIKNIVENVRIFTVDVTDAMYHCKKCGHLETMQILNIYVPKDIEKFKKKEVGNWTAGEPRWKSTIEELGGVPYWYPDYDSRNDFVMIYGYKHMCHVCGKKMNLVVPEKIANEKCQKCGKNYEVEELGILWD